MASGVGAELDALCIFFFFFDCVKGGDFLGFDECWHLEGECDVRVF